jgi:uncharacterized membrane protein YkvA (DUF1232 family)
MAEQSPRLEAVQGLAKRAGMEVVRKALQLFYVLRRPETPAWAKRTVIGALAYLVLPIDAIPDLLPLVGFTDDLAVITAALSTVAFYVNDDVRASANAKVEAWFGKGSDPAA